RPPSPRRGCTVCRAPRVAVATLPSRTQVRSPGAPTDLRGDLGVLEPAAPVPVQDGAAPLLAPPGLDHTTRWIRLRHRDHRRPAPRPPARHQGDQMKPHPCRLESLSPIEAAGWDYLIQGSAGRELFHRRAWLDY